MLNGYELHMNLPSDYQEKFLDQVYYESNHYQIKNSNNTNTSVSNNENTNKNYKKSYNKKR